MMKIITLQGEEVSWSTPRGDRLSGYVQAVSEQHPEEVDKQTSFKHC